MVAYHDEEWGVPLHDERRLFEMLCLEGAQAGLSWSTILNRRDGYRAGLRRASMPSASPPTTMRARRELLADARIIRNRAKVRAFRDNAARRAALRDEVGGLDAYLWGFVGGEPIVNHFESHGADPGRRRRWRRSSRRTSSGADSASSARSSSTPTCSRRASSTTTS